MEEMSFKLRSKEQEREDGVTVVGIENKCKGPEVGGNLVCSRDRGQTRMAGTREVRRTVLGDDFGELAGARSWTTPRPY